MEEVAGIELENAVAEARAADPDITLDEAVALAAEQAEAITAADEALHPEPPA